MDIKRIILRKYIDENFPENERKKIIEDIDKKTAYGPDRKASFQRYGDIFIFRVMSDRWLDTSLVFEDIPLSENKDETK